MHDATTKKTVPSFILNIPLFFNDKTVLIDTTCFDLYVVILWPLKYLRLKLHLQLNFSTVGSAVRTPRPTEEGSVNLDEKIITNLFSLTGNEI